MSSTASGGHACHSTDSSQGSEDDNVAISVRKALAEGAGHGQDKVFGVPGQRVDTPGGLDKGNLPGFPACAQS
jgi:hypothetical protein